MSSHSVEPVVDVIAILAAMQDQLDNLTATVEAQQLAIEALQQGLDARRS